MGTLSLTIKKVTVRNNGRPVDAPNTMAVGLVAQLTNPQDHEQPAIGDIAKVLVRANVGDTVEAFGGANPGWQPWGKGIAVPEMVRLDLLYVVSYDDWLSHALIEGVNGLVSVWVNKIPILGKHLKERLTINVDNALTEEYGRSGLLISSSAWAGGGAVPLTMKLYARNDIRGVFMKPATGDTVPQVSAPTTFVKAGELVAVVEMEGTLTEAKAAMKALPQPGHVMRRVVNESTADVNVATMAGVVLEFTGGQSQEVELVPGWNEFYYHATGGADSRVRLTSAGTDIDVDRRLDVAGSVHRAFKFRAFKDP